MSMVSEAMGLTARRSEQHGRRGNQDQAPHTPSLLVPKKPAQEVSEKLPETGGEAGKCHQRRNE